MQGGHISGCDGEPVTQEHGPIHRTHRGIWGDASYADAGARGMLNADVQRSGTTLIVVPHGVLGADLVGELRPEVRKHIEGGATEVILDFRDTRVLDSSGVGFLIATQNSLQKTGGKLHVIEVKADMYRLLASMRLDRHFTIEIAKSPP